jgi:hypothetical protein
MEAFVNLDSTNRWLTLATNFGVIAGIAFLAFELRQNTIATEVESASYFQSAFTEVEILIAENPEFAELLRKGRDGEKISGADQVRLQAFYRTVIRNWNINLFQYRSGVLNEGLWQGTRALITETFREDSGLYEHWRMHKNQVSPDFNELIEELTTNRL